MQFHHLKFTGSAHETPSGWYVRIHGHNAGVEVESLDEAEEAFQKKVNELIENGAEALDMPKGNFIVRLDPALHQAAREVAGKNDMSLNSWVAHIINEATRLTDMRGVEAKLPRKADQRGGRPKKEIKSQKKPRQKTS